MRLAVAVGVRPRDTFRGGREDGLLCAVVARAMKNRTRPRRRALRGRIGSLRWEET